MKKKYFNAKIYRNDSATEMIVEDGKIIHIGTDLPKCEEEIDLNGKLVLPPYVDPHLHLDYVYTLSELGKDGAGSGTLFEAIELWPQFKKTLTKESVKRLAMRGIKDEVSQGVQHIR
ncbi:MAG: cytosine deaminase, partial [Chitinophagales bacterium]|nr:cytosine deaminase [Chitinophagales bacterium]